MNVVLTRQYSLSPGDCNAQQEMPLSLLISQIIDIATDHANELGIGYKVMDGMSLGWVLGRLTVQMKRYPKVKENYTISTWIEGWNRHFSERNFEIADGEGNVIGYVQTVWFVINTETHENAGTSALTLPQDMISGKGCPIEKQGKYYPFHPQSIKFYRFKYADIDFYRHVNTVRYISLLLNQFTMEDFDLNFVKRLEISFMHEAHYGEDVEIRRAYSDGVENFSLCLPDRPILRAKVVLEKR